VARLNEETFLLDCARPALDPARIERVKALISSDLDWEYIRRVAVHNGVTPLVYATLKTLSLTEQIPPATLQTLRSEFFGNFQHTLKLTNELLRLLSLLEKNNVRAMPYKGPALASLLYEQVWLRQYVDLDLLIREGEMNRAMEVLSEAGYKPLAEPAQEFEPIRNDKAYTLARQDGGVIVELHWDITGRLSFVSSNFDVQQIWKNAQPHILRSHEILVPSPEDHFMILSIHASQHCWERLCWICDIAELIRTHPDLNWDRILTRARHLRIERLILMSVLLANTLLGAPLPAAIASRLKADSVPQSLAPTVRAWIFRESSAPLSVFETYPFSLSVRESLRDRARVLRAMIRFRMRPSTRDKVVDLPGPLKPLYVLVRPFRLAAEYGFGPIKQLLRVLMKS
jgi:hypothetical protein